MVISQNYVKINFLTGFKNIPPADPVNEEVLSENRKMITNKQLELYNEAAADVLNGRSRVKLLAASRQAALETITQSDDGLHLPEGTRNVVGRISVCCGKFSCSIRSYRNTTVLVLLTFSVTHTLFPTSVILREPWSS